MELKDTVDLMLSDDYKDRLKAEYYQLAIRTKSLMDRMKSGDKTLVFRNQMGPMRQYLRILKQRLDQEGIEVEELL